MNPFSDVNPKHLDMGELVDAKTGAYLGEATARHAADCLKAQRIEGVGHGIIRAPEYTDATLARVVRPEGVDLQTYRLMIAAKLRWERQMLIDYKNGQE